MLLNALDRYFRAGVEVDYCGQLGNRLTQYCAGRIIAERLGFPLFVQPIPGFPNVRCLGRPLFKQVPASFLNVHLVKGGHRLDLEWMFSDRRPRVILLSGVFARYQYYQPFKDEIRGSWLKMADHIESHPDDLTIHVRSGPDLWRTMNDGRRIHPEYHALPFSFYADIIRERPWRRILVVTEHPADEMVGKLVRVFGARVQSGTAFQDFCWLQGAHHLVLSVSSFAWWAAWLSHARTIYFPVAGLFDAERARTRPPVWQQDLWVCDEDRYRAIRPKIPAGDWTGTNEQRQLLLES